jgi:PAS domain S-box-containing protein
LVVLRRGAQNPAHACRIDRISVSTERVPLLVVDDRRENLVALEAALDSNAYEIVLAASGAEALAKLLDRDFAVILLDVAMPELDGYETARLIRARDKTRHIPIVFVTAFMSEAAQIFQGYEHGAVDYLIKPLDIHALRMKVSVFADLYRYAREVERTGQALARAEHQARVLADALYDVTFEDAPIGIAHVSDDIRWVRVNARMAAILRTTPDALRDRSMLDFVHPEDRGRLIADMNAVLAGSTLRHRCDCRMIDSDGGELWIHLSVSLIRDPAGNAVHLAIIEDVSEEKRLAEALERSERRFARLRDSGLIGIYEQDPSGVLTDANDAFLGMIGYGRDEIARRAVRFEDLVAPDSGSELVRDGVTPTHETRFIRKDGREGVMLAGAVANGVIVGFTLDVTSLREAEQLRARSALELERSLRARDDFVSILAHELRNPLTPLMMQIASLRAAAASAKEPLDGAWVDRQLDIVQRAAARLARLSEELLTVSRTTVGGFSLAREDLDLAALVRDVVARARGELERVRCTVDIHADGPVRGSWDRLALERVVSQILSNAMKYGPGYPIEITVAGDRDEATLTVRDHGIGIPTDQREMLFERYARLAPIQHYGGFGVGLWLVRRVVEAHGGQVSVSDPSGGGAEFVIRMPRGAETVDLDREAKPMSLTPAHVLLVDDDDDIREIMEMSLRGAGYEVRSAANGREALDEVAKEIPDIVLLDMMMPVMSGPEFLAAVRADDRYREMPVLIVTAWPREGASLPGAQGVLAKPIDLNELVRTIDRTVH